MVSVVIVSSLVALSVHFSYGSSENRTVKAAMSIIVLYTVAAPIVSTVGELSGISSDLTLDTEDIGSIGNTEYAKTAEEAFCDGICAAIAERYDLAREEIRARARGFNFEKMRAERITVILSGGAALSDYRSIAEYITGSGLGECEVKLEIG